MDATQDLIQRTDREGRFLYVNTAWRSVLGYGEDRVGDLTIYDILEGPSEPVRECLDKVFREAGAGAPLKLRYRGADGEVVHLVGRVTGELRDGETVAAEAVLNGVHGSDTARHDDVVASSKLRAILEDTREMIWSVGRDDRLTYFNSAFSLAVEARTGKPPELGQEPDEVFADDDADFYRTVYRRAFQGDRSVETRQSELHGESVHLEILCNPAREGDEITGAVLFARDVTEHIRAKQALRTAKDEAEAANRAKSEFLANMSHELRTPLNSVIGFVQIILKNKDERSSSEVNFLQRILANGRHLLNLINDILDLSKVEAGRMELEIDTLDLRGLISETVAQLEAQVRDRPVELIAELPRDVNPVETDRHRLKQVIMNLVSNALKFTHEGSVTVRLTTRDDGSTPEHIEVEDTGIGISQDRLERIFDAFGQAESTTTRKYGGTGLGLTISRSLCNLMGYELDVESEPGVGSTFFIRLHQERVARVQPEPVVEPEAAEAESGVEDESEGSGLEDGPGEPPGSRFRRGLKVLVVDDQWDSRVLLRHYFNDFGCRVRTAGSAEKGLEMSRQWNPDLITLDLQMPDMDGWEALDRLKKDPELRKIPVVVISVVAQEGRSRLLGALDLLTKPVEREDLLGVLWRQFARQRPRMLVVDDDEATRELLKHHLEDVGLEVVTAENGEQALRMVKRESPDAVMLDLVMPVMDGFTFLERLREDPHARGLPVIVVTAMEPSPEEKEKLEDWASGVILKGDALEGRIENVLGTLFSFQPE